VTLPNRGDYAGNVATVFIVGAGPKKSGCGFVEGWIAEWIKSGAQQGGYAIGRLAGIRCEEAGIVNSGPLGNKATQYSGTIHCDQTDELTLSTSKTGFWAYHRSTNTGSNPGNPRAAGPAIPGRTLSKAVARQLMTYASVQPDSITCPALPRTRGARVMCRVSGKELNGGTTELHGTVEVTIQDQTGHRAEDTYDLTGPGGAEIRGTGYPFDPDTGRVL
jgi:hypothetical protein